jgi:hypothetical protein
VTTAADTPLRVVVTAETERPLPFAVPGFIDAAQGKFGAAVAAILFYGSCRRVDQTDGLYDLYVIVDDYRCMPWFEAALARALPPNVYYLEATTPTGIRRSKCTVISQADFTSGVERWYHSYLWGRFSQPVSLAYARDAHARDATLSALCAAACKFLTEAVCLQGAEFDARTLWTDGLRTSYATELRSEGPDRADELFGANADYYEAVTRAAAPDVGLTATDLGRWRAAMSDADRARRRRTWRVRAVTGKLQALARILKAWITFDGGFDYIIWKLERHSGRHIDVPERVRRRPVIHMWGFFWRLYRAGVFR